MWTFEGILFKNIWKIWNHYFIGYINTDYDFLRISPPLCTTPVHTQNGKEKLGFKVSNIIKSQDRYKLFRYIACTQEGKQLNVRNYKNLNDISYFKRYTEVISEFPERCLNLGFHSQWSEFLVEEKLKLLKDKQVSKMVKNRWLLLHRSHISPKSAA